MTQLLLDIGRGRMPGRHFKWLLQANAGAMRCFTLPTRREFYAFKDRLLRERGLTDGVSLQTIIKVCNRCDALGHYVDRWTCTHCAGTGIYDVTHVRLQRWVLNDTVLHCVAGNDEEVPVDAGVLYADGEKAATMNRHGFETSVRLWALEHGYRKHYVGLMPRPWVPDRMALQAWRKLQWEYAPETLRNEHRCFGSGRLRDWIYGRA